MTGDLVRAMRQCPQPIIAAVEGVCAGAGAILAMASDIRFGRPGCKTAFLFTRVGLSGADMGACAILPRLIGHGRAAELLFTGRTMTSDEGLAWGFYNRLVEDVSQGAHALADELAKGPTIAHAVTKRQLDAEWNVTIDEAIEMEARAQARCMDTGDFRRAYEAFANKQKPVFQGN
jgi:enoyl-CoA hydratase/carnithine racemase